MVGEALKLCYNLLYTFVVSYYKISVYNRQRILNHPVHCGIVFPTE